jgi:hypothetical protein
MGQNQRRPGFLRWGEGSRPESGEPTSVADAGEQQADNQQAADQATVPDAAEQEPVPGASVDAPLTSSAVPARAAAEDAELGGETPFLRDLVGAMRGVAESSRDANLGGLRQAVDQKLEELGAAAAQRADELRRRSELDLNGVGDWERSELERVRAEAEQRREARRAQLEKELTEHQASADREVAATRARLADYERELEAFFARLSEIDDPAAFVAAAKRMPAAPDLARPGSPASPSGTSASAEADSAATDAETEVPAPSEETLSERLAQLDQRLAAVAPTAEPTTAAVTEPAAAATTATVAPPAPATNGTVAEASTAIVVKGLGSFGAITSFKQALERVDGISGVTLSLGPTGDFVYRASHTPEFDIGGAIRSIEGPAAAIEQVDGQLRVTIERPR